MHSSKKVIKASSIRIAPLNQCETVQGAAPFGGKRQHAPDDDARQEKDAKLESIRRKAFEQGIAEGVKRGIAQQKQEVSQLARSLTGLMSELTKIRKEFLGSIEKEVLDLAFAIAEKILNHEIAADKGVIRTVLGGALTKIVDQEGMRIRLNPQDYRYLTERNEEISAGLEGAKNFVLEEDAAIGQGGVVIVSLSGEVDARLDQQMSALRDALRGD